jgi:chemotaxis protein methyltransferase CheR
LAQVMAPDGFLALGAAETVVGLTRTLNPIPDKRGLYAPDHSADRGVGIKRGAAAKLTLVAS